MADEEVAWRDWLVKAHHTASQDYDKAVMTLAGGALGISLAFIRDIAPDPIHGWILAVAWCLLALSLLLIFVSLLSSQQAILTSIEKLDARETLTRGIAGAMTVWLNGLAGGAFVLGVGFLVSFAAVNL